MSDTNRVLRWQMALSLWYAKMIAATRAGEVFADPRPSLDDQQ